MEGLPRSEDQNQRYQSYGRTVPIQVEETIKGVAPKNLAILEVHNKWAGPANDDEQPQLPQQPQAGVKLLKAPKAPKADETPDFYSALAENKERRLFFLTENSDGDGYFEHYSSRRISPDKDALPVYISRLRELNGIYGSPTPSKQMIVEWLVAMAEDPATRFEGAYELRQALNWLKDNEEESAQKENDGSGEAVEVISDSDPAPIQGRMLPDYITERLDSDHKELVKLLTPAHKERLIAAFLNVRFTYKEVDRSQKKNSEDADEEYTDEEDGESDEPAPVEYEPVLQNGDAELLEAVAHFKDRRVISRLLGELPTVNRYNPWRASNMISIAADYFDDSRLGDLSEKYLDVNWGDENDLIEDEELSYDKPEPEMEGSTDEKSAQNTDENASDVASYEAKAAMQKAQEKAKKEAFVPWKTYGQRRAEILQQVLSRCTELMMKK